MLNFKKLLSEKYIILDGATGTELTKMGMPKGVSPEKWILDNEDKFINFQKKYVESGSDVIYAPTFSGNRIKLKEFGLENEVESINRKLVQLSKKAANNNAYVAGDMSPTGQFIKPYGPLEFEEVFDIYKEQAKALYNAGVDLFVIETMMDLQETRAAILAIKDICDLPIIATMTFNEDGRTLMGNDPETVCVVLQSLGIDAVGCNCSTGPDKMLELIKKMSKVARIPLVAKPNAGMPILRDGKTTFDMGADKFVTNSIDFLDYQVKIIGGCCGTDSKYIQKLSKKVRNIDYRKFEVGQKASLSTTKKTITFSKKDPLCVIGERINPTGKKDLKDALESEDYFVFVDLAEEEIDAGADIVDVNVSHSGIDEEKAMINVIEHLIQYTNVPICIDSANPDVIEKALRIYPGRAMINSITAEKEKLDKLIPVIKKYKPMTIALPIDDGGLTTNLNKRKEIIDKLVDELLNAGLEKEDILIDGLAMTASSNQEAARVSLGTINYAHDVKETNTVIGLSNVSFGLPARRNLNRTFLAMCMANGMNFAIMDPIDDELMNVKSAADVLYNRDEDCNIYVNKFAEQLNNKLESKLESVDDLDKDIYNALIAGKKSELLSLIDEALKKEKKPEMIIDEILLPAIDEVGNLYEVQKIFLPQLIKSAEAMEEAFDKLKKLLKKETNSSKGKVVLATVKGDIHDIGKNIVALMLRNNGYEVFDLGKDVCKNDIINAVIDNKADILGLSALMTTTMREMEEIVEQINKEKISVKVMVGGAVLSQKYADEIGADGYAKDAYSTVKLAGKLLAK